MKDKQDIDKSIDMDMEMENQKEYSFKVRDMNIGRQKKYVVNTFGCQMNEHDSEKLVGMLTDMGYVKADCSEDADIIIFNTCCVRENAEFKVIGNVGALKSLKREKPELLIAVCGCMMQQGEVVDYIKQKFKHVDIVFGTHNLHRFPQFVHTVLDSKNRVYEVWENEDKIYEGVSVKREESYKAYVTIMYGCNNFCSYCIVPYVRGRERSRKMEDVLDEIKLLVKNGVREVMLLGQNVNSYGNDLPNNLTFSDLLEKIDEIEDLWRIRFMTSHPKDLSDALINTMKNSKKICKSLHLPLQSGSSSVLKQMNRNYTKEKYLELIKRIRYHVSDIAISTDIIVGFPGETNDDFEDTLDVVKVAKFDLAYTFLYSKRTGTKAAKAENQVPDDVKNKRFQELLSLQTNICKELNEPYKGSLQEVLVEGKSKTNKQKLTGRTSTNKVVNFEGDLSLVGKLVLVKIDEAKTWSLEGSFEKVLKQ